MILDSIAINNFRSIDKLELDIPYLDGNQTYGLLGINESGKSSFLQALALLTDGEIEFPRDFYDKNSSIEINAWYILTALEEEKVKKTLRDKFKAPKHIVDSLKIDSIMIGILFAPGELLEPEVYESVAIKEHLFKDYSFNGEHIVKRALEDDLEPLDLESFFESQLNNYFYNLSHNVIFWRSSPEFLMLEEIDLELFSKNPKDISIPLFNCFKLTGIEEEKISDVVASLHDMVEISNLEAKLSNTITKHINKVWPEHPISIIFKINNKKISLLIEDNGIKYNAKTPKQRSDGFRQFISFLLTLSVENVNEELQNTILLIDEPETHLHPPAQMNLLNELISISNNKNNNVVFFATHSNYLIDKNDLSRNFKVVKIKNERTKLTRIERKNSSYAEVNFEVFNIPTTDYHNELYGFIELHDKSELDNLKKEKKWYNDKYKKEYEVSLAEYIRHSIHHPENEHNKKFTDPQLKKSISTLRRLKKEIEEKLITT